MADSFTASQRATIDAAIRDAETTSRLEFSVFVGPVAQGEDATGFARRLHAGMSSPARSVLLLVDPNQRLLEIVTGSDADRVLDPHGLSLVAAGLQSDLATGDLVGGLARAVRGLGERCRRPRVLHADTPEE
ncbi:DUF5130 family protein [Nocardioides mangrovicus]|nr:DUF5130 family protein [Nocardioides mangrovicus]